MGHALQIVVPFPTTLADLEAACATARGVGLPDDAVILPPGVFSTVMTVSTPRPAATPQRAGAQGGEER